MATLSNDKKDSNQMKIQYLKLPDQQIPLYWQLCGGNPCAHVHYQYFQECTDNL